MEAAVWGLIGTLIGALASIATTFIASRNAYALQGSAARLAREEQRRNFQRETLLQLQDELHRSLRLAAKCFLEDKLSFEKSGKWGVEPLSAELNEGYVASTREAGKLTERIADDALRSELKTLLALLNQVGMARTQKDAVRLTETMVSAGLQAMERIGAALRAEY